MWQEIRNVFEGNSSLYWKHRLKCLIVLDTSKPVQVCGQVVCRQARGWDMLDGWGKKVDILVIESTVKPGFGWY